MSGMFSTTLSGAPTHFNKMFSRSISSSVISGSNPSAYDSTNPITLFIIQLFIIIVFTQGLGWAFRYIRQPKVIAEVIGGIILGPTVMGRIPRFSITIFPKDSLPYLNLIATIGLILFLFLVGLEVDLAVMKKNGRSAAFISAAGMLLPFGVGAAVAVPIYNNFVNHSHTSFGHFLLFVGVAMSITAFPVLCRILVSAKLLDTKVGVIVLAAGVGNDVVGWVLLALTLALVNAKAGVTAVYVLLCAVGWAVLLLWPIKKGFVWLARRSGSIDHGPTPGMMVLTLLIVFASAFITDIIGVHPIFGGFIAGLIIPHEGGFAIALVEKIDDLVSLLFLPIYFVLSGLSTNLGLLDTGKIWAYVILLCTVAFLGKFIGCAAMAKFLKYNNRESGAIGMLMSCKGLVELIVLNVGLQVGIIDARLFSMFVVEAIVLTFATTPMTLWIYPERVRSRASTDLHRKPKMDAEKSATGLRFAMGSGGRESTSRFLVVLQKIEHLAAVMLLAQMLEPPPAKQRQLRKNESKGVSQKKLNGDISEESLDASTRDHCSTPGPVVETPFPAGMPLQIDALKLIELTGRTFSVMQSAEKDQLLLTDDALQLFRQFGRLRGLEVTPHISIVGEESFPAAVADHANGLESELVILPWTIPVTNSSSSNLIEPSPAVVEKEGINPSSSALSPFDSVFGSETHGSPMYTHFIRRVFAESPSDIALFIDRGFGSSASYAPGAGQHIFMPFFGGPDDRLALRFVVQLCHHINVTASIVRVHKTDDESQSVDSAKLEMSASMQMHQNALQSNQLTIGAGHSGYNETVNRLASETADDIAWSYYAENASESQRPVALDQAIRRVAFWEARSPNPLSYAHENAESSFASVEHGRLWRPMMIVTGRGRRGATINHGQEVAKILADKGQNPSIGAELRKTVGDAATALIIGGGQPSTASFLVLESGKK